MVIRHVGCFWLGDILTTASVYIFAQVFFWVCGLIPFCFNLRNEISVPTIASSFLFWVSISLLMSLITSFCKPDWGRVEIKKWQTLKKEQIYKRKSYSPSDGGLHSATLKLSVLAMCNARRRRRSFCSGVIWDCNRCSCSFAHTLFRQS